MAVEVITRGPLFDGRAQAAVREFADAAEAAVAKAGVEKVRQATSVFRRETGAYASRIQAEPSGDGWVINDGGSRYGPWLAGTSARNASTGFGGYDHWQQAARQLNQEAGPIAERVLPPYVARMNG